MLKQQEKRESPGMPPQATTALSRSVKSQQSKREKGGVNSNPSQGGVVLSSGQPSFASFAQPSGIQPPSTATLRDSNSQQGILLGSTNNYSNSGEGSLHEPLHTLGPSGHADPHLQALVASHPSSATALSSLSGLTFYHDSNGNISTPLHTIPDASEIALHKDKAEATGKSTVLPSTNSAKRTSSALFAPTEEQRRRLRKLGLKVYGCAADGENCCRSFLRCS